MPKLQADVLVPSSDMEAWGRDEVSYWALNLAGVDQNSVEILFNEYITGESLRQSEITDLTQMGVKYGPAELIILSKNELIRAKEKQCMPYPFGKYSAAHWYIEGDILNVAESGASDLIEPCHEFKAFANTTKQDKFVDEVIRFGASCLNSHTNGTIHFGIMDKPHGKVCGVQVDCNEKEQYDQKVRSAINKRFEFKDKDAVQLCIKPPRFVEVFNRNLTTTDKFVVEVDIVASNIICENKLFHTYSATTKEKQLFVREGSSCRNLLATTTFDKKMKDYKRFVSNVDTLTELRKQSEEKHLSVVKNHMQGSKLRQMITGGEGSLDSSYYKRYIVVTNDSHPSQLDSMRFLLHLSPSIVFDLEKRSLQTGLFRHILKYPGVKNITEDCESSHELKAGLLPAMHWLFSGKTSHSAVQLWIQNHRAVPFPFQKDFFRDMKFLVVFLILSEVDQMDTVLETFCTFYQELKATKQILCICDNENVFISWKNLIDARCDVDISNRCIFKLSFAEVNGTILSLLSKNRRSWRFLPGAGGGRVLLEEEVERQLTTLEVLCVNQCEGGNEDRDSIEQNFYKGGEVSWWNFYFSEQPGSIPLMKSDKFAYIIDTLIPNLCSLRKACVHFNLLHVPRCGGTTLAKHILWALKEKFRSAVLIDNDADPVTVAEHVVTLLQCGCKEQEPPVPVLLMIDDFEDMNKVLRLQELIDKQCLISNVQSRSPHVVLLNCMRSEYKSGPTDPTEDTVIIGNKLTDDEQKHANTETFYGFMVMKNNFSTEDTVIIGQDVVEDQKAEHNIFHDLICQNIQECSFQNLLLVFTVLLFFFILFAYLIPSARQPCNRHCALLSECFDEIIYKMTCNELNSMPHAHTHTYIYIH